MGQLTLREALASSQLDAFVQEQKETEPNLSVVPNLNEGLRCW